MAHKDKHEFKDVLRVNGQYNQPQQDTFLQEKEGREINMSSSPHNSKALDKLRVYFRLKQTLGETDEYLADLLDFEDVAHLKMSICNFFRRTSARIYENASEIRESELRTLAMRENEMVDILNNLDVTLSTYIRDYNTIMSRIQAGQKLRHSISGLNSQTLNVNNPLPFAIGVPVFELTAPNKLKPKKVVDIPTPEQSLQDNNIEIVEIIPEENNDR